MSLSYFISSDNDRSSELAILYLSEFFYLEALASSDHAFATVTPGEVLAQGTEISFSLIQIFL